MNYLLDTCVVSELVKEVPNEQVVDWLADCSEDDLHLSVITFGELEKGIAKLPPSRRRERIRTWIDHDLHERFQDRTFDVDARVATRWGLLMAECEFQGHTLPVVDAFLAATALVYDLVIVSRNVRDLAVGGVQVFNPWND